MASLRAPEGLQRVPGDLYGYSRKKSYELSMVFLRAGLQLLILLQFPILSYNSSYALSLLGSIDS